MYQNYKTKNNFSKAHKNIYNDQFNKEDYAESVKKYYADLAIIPTLKKDEETELIRNHYVDGCFDDFARNRLLEGNLKFVFKVASFYRGSGVPMADLISQGNEGLIKALDKFDVGKDIRFYCYAVWWIKAKIQQYVKAQMKHQSREGVEFNTNINEEDEEDSIFNNSAELWSDVETDNNIEFSDEMFGDESDDFQDDGEVVADEDINVRQANREDKARTNFIQQMTSVLTEQEYDVLKYTFGLGGVKELSVREICETMQLKTSKVKSLKEKALSKLNELACKDVVLKEMYV